MCEGRQRGGSVRSVPCTPAVPSTIGSLFSGPAGPTNFHPGDVLVAGKVSTARSAEFLLPRPLSELVLGGMELGAADDEVGPCHCHALLSSRLSRLATGISLDMLSFPCVLLHLLSGPLKGCALLVLA